MTTLFDVRIALFAEDEQIAPRLTARTMRGGTPAQEAEKHVRTTDRPNARRFREHFAGADVTLKLVCADSPVELERTDAKETP